MRNWLKTLLFLSAFSPALITIAVARYMDKGYSPDVAYYAAVGAAGGCLSMAIIKLIQIHGEIINFSAKKIDSNDALMLGVLLSYALPLIGKTSEITVNVVICLIVLAGLVLWMTNALLPHPVLRVFGYRFYKVESDRGTVYTLLAQRELIDPKNVTQVRRISSTMLVEVR